MVSIGVNYDTGLVYGGRNTRRRFDADVVRNDMSVIAAQLHAPAVRISGGDPDRLVVAAEAALAAGLDVWFSPMPVDVEPAEFVPFLADCAARAETLRQAAGPEVVMVLGCELTLFCKGFVPGIARRSGSRC